MWRTEAKYKFCGRKTNIDQNSFWTFEDEIALNRFIHTWTHTHHLECTHMHTQSKMSPCRSSSPAPLMSWLNEGGLKLRKWAECEPEEWSSAIVKLCVNITKTSVAAPQTSHPLSQTLKSFSQYLLTIPPPNLCL